MMKYNYKSEEYFQSYNYPSYIDFVSYELFYIIKDLRFAEFVTIIDRYDNLVVIATLLKALNKYVKVNFVENDVGVPLVMTISYDYGICIESLLNNDGQVKETTSDLMIINKSNVKKEFYIRSLHNNERALLYDIERE